ncbi:MAG: molecular chaperone TorD family protein [Caldilineaceae bacterium]|nr:molecular chaperone TorD family protein [Caldilineaceae bacterium]
MNVDLAFRRSQIYGFLSLAVLYPQEDWTDDALLVEQIRRKIDFAKAALELPSMSLPQLQAAHRRAFGAAGSLCYETEYGLPHEFRQAQEMADICGFYRAFGFESGGELHDRPDHVAVEMEFMHVLALKEAYALHDHNLEHAEVAVDAQRKFLEDHLGNWISLFAQSLRLNAGDELYPALSHFIEAFVGADARRLGAKIQPRRREEVQHTPIDPDFSCDSCALKDGIGSEISFG